MNLADRIEQAARRWAGDIVLLTVSSDADDPGGGPVTGRTTWEELYSMVMGLCSGLADGGLRRGDRLAVLMRNSCEMVASEWACLVAGFVWVSFNTRSSAAELTRLLADCSPGVLLVSNECTWPVTTLLQSEHPLSGSLDERSSRLRSCGRPARRVEVRVVDEAGRDVVGALPGEVLLRGPNTMSGYWRPGKKSPGRASADDLDSHGLDEQGWVHTGDLGFFDDEGFLTVLDRLDDTIITGGFNVHPREVEDALSSHPAVLESAVVGRDDPEWGRSVHAVVVCRPGAQIDEQELKQHCAALLSDYKKPRTVEFADSLPRNPSGKTLRRVLRS